MCGPRVDRCSRSTRRRWGGRARPRTRAVGAAHEARVALPLGWGRTFAWQLPAASTRAAASLQRPPPRASQLFVAGPGCGGRRCAALPPPAERASRGGVRLRGFRSWGSPYGFVLSLVPLRLYCVRGVGGGGDCGSGGIGGGGRTCPGLWGLDPLADQHWCGLSDAWRRSRAWGFSRVAVFFLASCARRSRSGHDEQTRLGGNALRLLERRRVAANLRSEPPSLAT